jgi:hypothetical protein
VNTIRVAETSVQNNLVQEIARTIAAIKGLDTQPEPQA